MNAQLGAYDPETQMFVESPRELDYGYLRMVRVRAIRERWGRQPIYSLVNALDDFDCRDGRGCPVCVDQDE